MEQTSTKPRRKTFYQAESQEEIIRLIDIAILYYNTKRIHSNHKDKSPLQFLQETLNKRKTIINL